MQTPEGKKRFRLYCFSNLLLQWVSYQSFLTVLSFHTLRLFQLTHISQSIVFFCTRYAFDFAFIFFFCMFIIYYVFSSLLHGFPFDMTFCVCWWEIRRNKYSKLCNYFFSFSQIESDVTYVKFMHGGTRFPLESEFVYPWKMYFVRRHWCNLKHKKKYKKLTKLLNVKQLNPVTFRELEIFQFKQLSTVVYK